MQIVLLRTASEFKVSKQDITSTVFKLQADCSRNRVFMSCIGNSLLCVTAVNVVCSCESYCAEC